MNMVVECQLFLSAEKSPKNDYLMHQFPTLTSRQVHLILLSQGHKKDSFRMLLYSNARDSTQSSPICLKIARKYYFLRVKKLIYLYFQYFSGVLSCWTSQRESQTGTCVLWNSYLLFSTWLLKSYVIHQISKRTNFSLFYFIQKFSIELN